MAIYNLTSMLARLKIVPFHLPSAGRDVAWFLGARFVGSALTPIAVETHFFRSLAGNKLNFLESTITFLWTIFSVAWLGMLDFNGQGFTFDVLGTVRAGHLEAGLNMIAVKRTVVNTLQTLVIGYSANRFGQACQRQRQKVITWCGPLGEWLLGAQPPSPTAASAPARAPLVKRAARVVHEIVTPTSRRVVKITAVFLMCIVYHPLVVQGYRVLNPRAGYISKVQVEGSPRPLIHAWPEAGAQLYQNDLAGQPADMQTVSPAALTDDLSVVNAPVGPSGPAPFQFYREPVVAGADGQAYWAQEAMVQQKEQHEYNDDQGRPLPNFIVLFAEALETVFTDEAVYPGLLPGLGQAKSNSLSFANIEAPFSATFSLAGKVAVLCGHPFPLPLDQTRDTFDNEMLNDVDTFLPGSRCLQDILAARGYHVEFHTGSDAGFAGVKHFTAQHGGVAVLDRANIWNGGKDGWCPDRYKSYWGYTDDVSFDVSSRRVEELRAARAGVNTQDVDGAPWPRSPYRVTPVGRGLPHGPDPHEEGRGHHGRDHDGGHEHEDGHEHGDHGPGHHRRRLKGSIRGSMDVPTPPVPSPGQPWALFMETNDMHNPPERNENACHALGRGVYPGQASPMLNAAYCFDATVTEYINRVADNNTVILVVGDHLNYGMDLKLTSLAWNAARDADSDARYNRSFTRWGPSNGVPRADGRLPGETVRVASLIHSPGRVLPYDFQRHATTYDLVPTMLELAGLGRFGIGLGRSLLAQGAQTLPEWALAAGVDHNDELEAWAYDDRVRLALWHDKGMDDLAQCGRCGLATVQ